MSSAEPDEASEPDGEGLLDEAELSPVGAAVLVFAPLLADVLLLADTVAEEVVVAVALTLALAVCACTSQWNGSNSVFGSVHDGFLEA